MKKFLDPVSRENIHPVLNPLFILLSVSNEYHVFVGCAALACISMYWTLKFPNVYLVNCEEYVVVVKIFPAVFMYPDLRDTIFPAFPDIVHAPTVVFDLPVAVFPKTKVHGVTVSADSSENILLPVIRNL